MLASFYLFLSLKELYRRYLFSFSFFLFRLLILSFIPFSGFRICIQSGSDRINATRAAALFILSHLPSRIVNWQFIFNLRRFQIHYLGCFITYHLILHP